MTASTDRLLQELLQLPATDREELLERFFDAIGEPQQPERVDLGPEWSEEIRRRIEEFESGKAETMTSAELLAFMQADSEDGDA